MNENYAQHRFTRIWAFEKVLNSLSFISNIKMAKLKFFKNPYFGKLYLVVCKSKHHNPKDKNVLTAKFDG